MINEVNYIFELDEEGNYRALGTPSEAADINLLRAVAEKLQQWGSR